AGHEAAVFFEDHAVLSASVFLLDLRKSDRREERFEIAFVSIGHRYFAASLAHQQQVVEPSPVVFWNGIDLFPEPRRAFFLRLHLRGFLRGCGRNVDIHRRRFDGFRGHSWQCFSPRSIHCVRATQAHYIARERTATSAVDLRGNAPNHYTRSAVELLGNRRSRVFSQACTAVLSGRRGPPTGHPLPTQPRRPQQKAQCSISNLCAPECRWNRFRSPKATTACSKPSGRCAG